MLLFFSASCAWAHVPALLLPLKGTPITSYFLGQSEISRAVYSEITEAEDFFVLHFYVKGGEPTLVQLLTPLCEGIPQYEEFQPSAVLLKGDLPWKRQGESNQEFVRRLEKSAVAKVSSNFRKGKRPTYFESFAKQTFWVGGETKRKLSPGLYSIVVYSKNGGKGNFTLGLNEKEAWTPDLYKYVAEELPAIAAGICRPTGFTGNLRL